MLPKASRLARSADFALAVRRGRRVGGPRLVLHWYPADVTSVGFVVSKAVGNAVVRNRVKRRLRHLMAARLHTLPTGMYVVRAQPAAASSSYPELGTDLDRCLARQLRKSGG